MPEIVPLKVVRVFTVRPTQARFGVVIQETETLISVKLKKRDGHYVVTFCKTSKVAVNQKNNWWPLRYSET